jgi:hypothetical protein
MNPARHTNSTSCVRNSSISSLSFHPLGFRHPHGDAALPGDLEARRALPVTDHDGDLGVELPPRDAVVDGFEGGAAARDQNAEIHLPVLPRVAG